MSEERILNKIDRIHRRIDQIHRKLTLMECYLIESNRDDYENYLASTLKYKERKVK